MLIKELLKKSKEIFGYNYQIEINDDEINYLIIESEGSITFDVSDLPFDIKFDHFYKISEFLNCYFSNVNNTLKITIVNLNNKEIIVNEISDEIFC